MSYENELTEEKAVAILMANLKGPKVKPSDWIQIAEACRKLRNSDSWGLPKMASFFQVANYLLRQIDSLNQLHPEVKKLVRNRELGLDEAFLISKMPYQKQLAVARFAIQSKINSKELRQLAYLIAKYPNKDFEQVKSLFAKTRQKKKMRLLILPLDSELYVKLKQGALRSRMKIQDFIFKAVEEKIENDNRC